jgi:hypothetical protein
VAAGGGALAEVAAGGGRAIHGGSTLPDAYARRKKGKISLRR